MSKMSVMEALTFNYCLFYGIRPSVCQGQYNKRNKIFILHFSI